MKRSTSTRNIYYLIGIGLLIILWQAFSLLLGEDTMVFPGPVSTVTYALQLLGRGYTYRCIASTLLRMMTGFLISFVLALLFGIPAGNDPRIRDIIAPIITALRAIPTASLVYLFIVLAGFKTAPMLLVILVSFPIIYEGVAGGIRSVSKELIEAARSDGASRIRENIRIRFPLALPYLIVAMTSSFSLCFKIEIMAEVITGASTPGLGSVISGVRASDPTNMVPVFAYSLIAVVLMLGIDFISRLIRSQSETN